jgi:hypothetical protein
MTKRLFIIFAIGIVVLVLAYFVGPAALQGDGPEAARSYADQLELTLGKDPRFANVSTRVTSMPSINLIGRVQDVQALMDVKAMAVAPPDAKFEVFSTVTIDTSPATTQSTTQP